MVSATILQQRRKVHMLYFCYACSNLVCAADYGRGSTAIHPTAIAIVTTTHMTLPAPVLHIHEKIFEIQHLFLLPTTNNNVQCKYGRSSTSWVLPFRAAAWSISCAVSHLHKSELAKKSEVGQQYFCNTSAPMPMRRNTNKMHVSDSLMRSYSTFKMKYPQLLLHFHPLYYVSQLTPNLFAEAIENMLYHMKRLLQGNPSASS